MASFIIKSIGRNTHDFHDTYETAADAIRAILDYAKLKGASVCGEEDDDHPNHYDYLILTNHYADQYAIEPVK